MKVKDVPYVRIWPKLFDYKSKDTTKIFSLDFWILVLLNTILFGFLNYYQAYFSPYSKVLAFVLIALFYLQFLSLSARRLNDIGAPYLLCLVSLTVIGIVFVFAFCQFRSGMYIKQESVSSKKRFNPSPYIVSGSVSLVSVLLFPFLVFVYVIARDIACERIIGPTVWTIDRDINHYNERVNKTKNASIMMPNLSEIGDYKNLRFAYQWTVDSLLLSFDEYTISLFVTYENNYQSIKESTNEKYESLYLNKERSDFMLCEFEYRGYDLKIVPDLTYWKNKDGEGIPTVKSFMMVGFNDAKSTITYLYFYDFDLDCISYEGSLEGATYEFKLKEMRSFLKTYFYWY